MNRLLFGSLDMAVVNTYVAHNASKEQQLLFQEFRRDLAMGLLTCTFSRGCRPSGVPKKGKIASSVSPSVRLSNVEIRLPQFIHKKGRCEACSKKADVKRVRKKEFKIDLLASVLIATSIFAATLQKTALLNITRESYSWK